MLAFLDCETTGIGPDARVIQLGIDLCHFDGRTVASMNCIVNQMVPSHPRAVEVHGITDERQAAEGLDRTIAAQIASILLAQATIVIGHNVPFDIEMVGYSFPGIMLSHKESYCTMRRMTDRVKIPAARGGYKWPKLVEAYRWAFKEDFDNAHDAWADVQACKRLYFWCKENGL